MATCYNCKQPGFSWKKSPYSNKLEGMWDGQGNMHFYLDENGKAKYTCPRAVDPNESGGLTLNPDGSVGDPWTEKVDKAVEAAEAARKLSLTTAMNFSRIGEEFSNLEAEVAQWAERINQVRPIEINVRLPDGTRQVVGRAHKSLEDLIQVSACREPAYLKGPAGSGKSTGVGQMANVFDLPMVRYGINPQTTKADFFGYNNMATGAYVSTPARRMYEGGGVLFVDEIDRGLAGMMTVLNTLADEEAVTFPDGVTCKRHENFILVAAGNTYGVGADAVYVGANQLDGATLDRFSFIDWDYDWEMIHAVAGNPQWSLKVQRWNKAAVGLNVVITPRAAIKGARLLSAGLPEDRVAEMVVWGKIKPDHRRTIESRVSSVG